MLCRVLALCVAALALHSPELRPELMVQALHKPTRCQCIHTAKSIPPKHVDNFMVYDEGAACSTKEIILSLKNGFEKCLDPSKKQGKRLISCWNRIKKKAGKKESCIKRKGRKRAPGKKRPQKKQS